MKSMRNLSRAVYRKRMKYVWENRKKLRNGRNVKRQCRKQKKIRKLTEIKQRQYTTINVAKKFRNARRCVFPRYLNQRADVDDAKTNWPAVSAVINNVFLSFASTIPLRVTIDHPRLPIHVNTVSCSTC